MQLDQLQLDLRPRTHAQALDLGTALVRRHALSVWSIWLAVWLPVCLLSGVILLLFPDYADWTWFLPWWLRPLLERPLLLVLSRLVFSETITTREALRAWPSLCRGGWFRLLTWGRLVMPGRGLYQPIWVLEGARGPQVRLRMRYLGGGGAGTAAWWYGITFVHFEAVLQFGLLGLVGLFMGAENAVNPFALLVEMGDSGWLGWIGLALVFIQGCITAPLYTAGCFTLYLNRRAQLEGWDLEILLRQLPAAEVAEARPAAPRAAAPALAAVLGAGLLLVSLLAPAPAEAATNACAHLQWTDERVTSHQQHQSAEQQRLRQRLRQLYARPELASHECQRQLKYVGDEKDDEKDDDDDINTLEWLKFAEYLAAGLRVLAIGALLLVIAWLLYRYREPLRQALKRQRPEAAREVAGLDIRPESLPPDVVAEVLQLWQAQQQRAALALLYRATLSRLVQQHHWFISRGATEGDCLRLARGRLTGERLRLIEWVTTLWLDGAWGGRWPATDTLHACCQLWRRELEQTA